MTVGSDRGRVQRYRGPADSTTSLAPLLPAQLSNDRRAGPTAFNSRARQPERQKGRHTRSANIQMVLDQDMKSYAKPGKFANKGIGQLLVGHEVENSQMFKTLPIDRSHRCLICNYNLGSSNGAELSFLPNIVLEDTGRKNYDFIICSSACFVRIDPQLM